MHNATVQAFRDIEINAHSSFDILPRAIMYSSLVLAVSTLFIHDLLLKRTIFLKLKSSRNERIAKSYILAALACAICIPLHGILFFMPFLFLYLASKQMKQHGISGSKKYWRFYCIYIAVLTVVIGAGWAISLAITLHQVLPNFIHTILEQQQTIQ